MNIWVFVSLMWVFACLLMLALLLIKGKKYVNSLPLHEREILKNSGIELLVPLQKNNRMSGILLLAGNYRKPIPVQEQQLLTSGSECMLADIESVKKKRRDFYRAIADIIRVVSQVVGSRDPYTASHQRRVAQLARAIAGEIGLSGWQVTGIYVTGLLHDVGKVSVPSEILSKPGKINSSEFDIIRNHCRAGYDILQKVDFPWPVADVVLQHHERLDGSGYPEGLSGGDIVLEARILGVADVVEAMSSHRPYRPALGLDSALDEIKQGSGTRYDSEVVAACLKVLDENEVSFNEIMAAADNDSEGVLEMIS